MKGLLLLLTLVFVVTTTVVTASEIDGKWKGKTEGQNGPTELVFNFKVDGQTLTGTVTSEMGEQQIENGKVNGSEFTFDVSVMDFTIKHKCKVDGDKVDVKFDMGQGENSMTLNRIPQKE